VAESCFQDESIIEAFVKVPRHKFLDEALFALAYQDNALPIGFGQTISKPSTVAYMTYLLELRPEDEVLEIGTGSGFQAAILSRLCKMVYTVERIPQLYQRASSILRSLHFGNIRFKIDNGKVGWEENAPFDKIIITAGHTEIPEALVSQLKEGGKVVLPLNNEIVVGIKENGEIKLKCTNRQCKFVDFVS
jgi:protein-L-isoaspartate(D-aspartate) O-methyltransferase